MSDDDAAIRLQNVSVTFTGTDRPAVDNLSFSVRKGEFVSLIGPSGCGKSTTTNIIARLLSPDVAQVDGEIELRAERLGYVFQRDALLPWRTALRNVEVGLEIRGRSLLERRREASELLQKFGLGGYLHSYPHQLSGGMRQRVSLSRTLVYDPDVILMDEPFGALDVQTRVLLQAEFMKICANTGKTILLITHDLSEAITMSDRILVLSHRPAHVCAEYQIELRRRDDPLALRNSPEFLEIHSKIWDVLSAEVRRQHAA